MRAVAEIASRHQIPADTADIAIVDIAIVDIAIAGIAIADIAIAGAVTASTATAHTVTGIADTRRAEGNWVNSDTGTLNDLDC